MLHNAIISRPVLGESQLKFRLDLVAKRIRSYPLDNMDFLLMDLQRPSDSSRHADWWTGDLSGRMLEFLSCAWGIDSQPDNLVHELFERILKYRQPSGLIGKFACSFEPILHEDHAFANCDRLFPGLIRYYELTNDQRALDCALGIGDWHVKNIDNWAKILTPGFQAIQLWVTEPLSMLYKHTGNKKYLEICGMISESLTNLKGWHSHGIMSTLRGLQKAALFSNDLSWNEKPERFRREIIDCGYELPDGGICECFPRSFRNEGCSIADWLMLNLYAGLIDPRTDAYEKVQLIFWNALSSNQSINGGFGHRDLMSDGYARGVNSECWWCCTEHCGMAMTELARHVVTMRDNKLNINFLFPGEYSLAYEKNVIKVRIDGQYPSGVASQIHIVGLPPSVVADVDLPGFIKHGTVGQKRSGLNTDINVQGFIGHTIESQGEGYLLKYGPAILAPMIYYWQDSNRCEIVNDSSSVPSGYIPASLPAGRPSLLLPGKDSNGLLDFTNYKPSPKPEWTFFEEGQLAKTAIPNATVTIWCRFRNGQEFPLQFNALCQNTSNMTYYDAPIKFRDWLQADQKT